MRGVARADVDESLNAQTFKPAVDPFGYATVNGARTLDMFQLHAAAFGSYARAPLRFSGEIPVPRGTDIIRELTVLDLVAAFGVLKIGNGGIEIGADLPVILENNGLRVDDRELGMQDQGFGELRTEAKLTFLDRAEDAMGVALRGFVELPTAREEDMLSNNGKVSIGGTLILEKKVWLIRAGIEVGYQHIDGEVKLADLTIGDATYDDKILVGAGLGIELFETIDIFGEITHSTLYKHPYESAAETPFEAGGGVKFRGSLLFAALGASAGLNSGVGAPEARIFGALGLTF
jgi:hypothetical protein